MSATGNGSPVSIRACSRGAQLHTAPAGRDHRGSARVGARRRPPQAAWKRVRWVPVDLEAVDLEVVKLEAMDLEAVKLDAAKLGAGGGTVVLVVTGAGKVLHDALGANATSVAASLVAAATITSARTRRRRLPAIQGKMLRGVPGVAGALGAVSRGSTARPPRCNRSRSRLGPPPQAPALPARLAVFAFNAELPVSSIGLTLPKYAAICSPCSARWRSCW